MALANRNLELSNRRINSVIWVKEVGILATAFTKPQPHGEWETTPATDDKKQEKEDDAWRKVVVKISPIDRYLPEAKQDRRAQLTEYPVLLPRRSRPGIKTLASRN